MNFKITRTNATNDSDQRSLTFSITKPSDTDCGCFGNPIPLNIINPERVVPDADFFANWDRMHGRPAIFDSAEAIMVYIRSQLESPETVISQMDLGSISQGDSVDVGTITDNAETLKAILRKTYYPTFVDPSFSFAHNAEELHVIGDVIPEVELSADFDRGSVLGAVNEGVWEPETEVSPRTGPATGYRFIVNGVITDQADPVLLLEDHIVTVGLNTFSSRVSFDAGEQPVDSDGNDYDTPHAAGDSVFLNKTIEGVWPIFATTADIDTLDQQALHSMLTGNYIELDLVGEAGEAPVVVEEGFDPGSDFVMDGSSEDVFDMTSDDPDSDIYILTS